MRNFAMRQVGWLLLILLMHPIWDLHTADAMVSNPDQEKPHFRTALKHDGNILKILSVLGKKTDDPNLLRKAKEKLFTLSNMQAQLIASLSDRISGAGGENTVGTDIAFLLITALIILS
jgi:hypothetical protein